MSLDREMGFLSAIHRNKILPIGLAIQYYGINNIDGRNEYGFRTGPYSDKAYCVHFSSSLLITRPKKRTKVNHFLSIGVNIKGIIHNIATTSAIGYGIDCGLLYDIESHGGKPGVTHTRFGFSIQNILGSIKWNSQIESRDPLPCTLRVGASLSAKFDNSGLFESTLAGQAAYTFKEIAALYLPYANYGLGIELAFQKYYKIRIGYNSNSTYNSHMLSISDLTYGFGVTVGTDKKGVTIDYSYTPDYYMITRTSMVTCQIML
jgi:hypothetical protein